MTTAKIRLASIRVLRIAARTPNYFLWILLCLSVGIFSSYFYYTAGMDRSILISANSEVTEIQFSRKTIWKFDNALVCAPVPRTRSIAVQSGESNTVDELCKSSDKIGSGSLTVTWLNGSNILVRRKNIGPLEVQLLDQDSETQNASQINLDGQQLELQKNTRIVISPENVLEFGALDFTGVASFGKLVGQGNQAILIGGDYEIRERLPMREPLELMRTGTLLRGDVVSIFDDGQPKKDLTGFFSSPGPEDVGFHLVASATIGGSSGNSEGLNLRLTRHGSIPTSIGTRWTDRALADPLTIALTAILGTMAVLLTILSEIYALVRRCR